MRRAIAAAVASGLVLGGVTAAAPAWAGTHGANGNAHGATKRQATAVKATTASRTIVYHGYEFQAPASWPVYRLDLHPSTCVRYDVHAVYLGTPSADMRCPAGLIGRTETVSVIPSGQIAAGSGGEVTYQRWQPDGAGGSPAGQLPAVGGTVSAYAAQRELHVAIGAAGGVTVRATYGADRAVVQRALASLRRAPAGAADTPQSAPAAPAPAERGARPVAATASPQRAAAATPPPTTTRWHGLPRGWPVQIVLPPPGPKPRPLHLVNGFDACTAPSLAAMRAWRSQYGGIGVYIGGINAACAYGNLSASWVRASQAMGWGLIPTYVGPQAPCWGYRGATIDPNRAAAQGRAAGADAVRDAKLLGLRAGSPIYDDMEAYAGGSGCTVAVLTFLGAWDRAVTAAGYVSGVYSSRDSGIADMERAAVAHTRWFAPPDAIWIALWDGRPTLTDGTLAWPLSERAKQWAGPHNQKIGRYTLNIDSDIIGGPLAVLPALGVSPHSPPRALRAARARGGSPVSSSREPPRAHKLM